MSQGLTRVVVNNNFFLTGSYLPLSGGTVSGNTLFTQNLSAATIFSGSANLYDIFQQIGTDVQTLVQPGSNITTGGTPTNPIVSVVSSPSFDEITLSGTGRFVDIIFTGITTGGDIDVQNLIATAITDSSLFSGDCVYVGLGGLLKTDNAFSFNDSSKLLFTQNLQVGSPSLSGAVTIWGDLLIVGESISAFTSTLFVEDNNIFLNFNSTASTISTSLGAGWTIQDGSGISGTNIFFDIRGTAATIDARSFSTNLNDLRIRESGTTSSPNGARLLAEYDYLDAGEY